ncbi:MAG: alpha/beta hydrolase [Desulfobacterales bacterium]|nr:alpha/beta hydrolase [Desulfobacterales bacterium]
MKKKIMIIVCLLSVLVTPLTGIAHSNDFEMNATDKDYTVNILFSQYTIRGVHYQPVPDTGKPLLVLVHGATYGKWMWDVLGYSWIDRFARQEGYPILVIDRLGYGDSSRLNGDILTPRCQVHTLKQMLCQIRQSQGQRPIIWAGHSMGALFGNMIAGESSLIDGLIAIGWVHGRETLVGPPPTAFLKGDYITYTDEERTASFYHVEGADPQIIAYDNQRAEAAPRGGVWSGIDPDRYVLGFIDVPVLLAAGQYDALWEDIDLTAEAALFTNAPVTIFLQPDAGHTNLLHYTHTLFLDVLENWLTTSF